MIPGRTCIDWKSGSLEARRGDKTGTRPRTAGELTLASAMDRQAVADTPIRSTMRRASVSWMTQVRQKKLRFPCDRQASVKQEPVEGIRPQYGRPRITVSMAVPGECAAGRLPAIFRCIETVLYTNFRSGTRADRGSLAQSLAITSSPKRLTQSSFACSDIVSGS